MKNNRSEALYARARKCIPGGVNSPVRAFRSVGTVPRFIKEADGAYITDEDNNRYLDFVSSWGPMMLGHNHPEVCSAVERSIRNGLSYGAATKLEVEMAELICSLVPSIEMVRMVNSGTEAVMSAVRLARGYTGKDKIIKMEGCYHGHSDALLVKAGSGLMTEGIPSSAGVTAGTAADTLSVPYNDLERTRALFERYGQDIAAVIIEPVAANMGVVLPEEDYLEGLRKLCDAHGSLLIFDEVITGFRIGIKGAQGYYGVRADLVTYGKIIGGGMPVGAFGGRKEIMELLAPLGPVYQAGTLSGNPVAMTAGLTTLRYLADHPNLYADLGARGDRMRRDMREICERKQLPFQVSGTGSLSCLFFTDRPVRNYDDALTCDTERFASYFRAMLGRGIYLAPSQFEAQFLSIRHGDDEIRMYLDALEDIL